MAAWANESLGQQRTGALGPEVRGAGQVRGTRGQGGLDTDNRQSQLQESQTPRCGGHSPRRTSFARLETLDSVLVRQEVTGALSQCSDVECVCVCVCGVNRQEPAALVKTTHHGGLDWLAEA